MSQLFEINEFSSGNGELSVIEKILTGSIKRVYYIQNVDKNTVRGGHRHKKTSQLLVAIKGSCEVYCDNGQDQNYYRLENNKQGLLLEPEDWHQMKNFTEDCILLVLANKYYDIEDYIDEPYDFCRINEIFQ